MKDVKRDHVCYRCFKKFDQTPDNPERTDWCVKCGHRSAGIQRKYVVGDWLIVYIETAEDKS
jgi:rRNA maturation endonuclease Nob1